MEKEYKEKLLRWMNIQVKLAKDFLKYQNFDDDIMMCSTISDNKFQVFTGIEEMCDATEQELMCMHNDKDYEPYVYTFYFYYKGIKFFELVTEDEYKDGVIAK